MTVDDGVMQKLWKLTNELTAQLVFNRNATLELKQQLADLQAKTAQGPVAIAQGVPSYSPQEHADWSLRIANERLQEENAQLQEQLREYERWMEYIMTKFRLQNFAMAQSRKEALHDAYRMADQEGELTSKLQEENAILQARLVDVGVVARKAISEEYYNTESIIETLEMENQGLREMLGVATDHSMNPIAASTGNRVSFPSTGSYAASSGSDHDLSPQKQPILQPHDRKSTVSNGPPASSLPSSTTSSTTVSGASTPVAVPNEAVTSLAKHAAQLTLDAAEAYRLESIPTAIPETITSTEKAEIVEQRPSKAPAGKKKGTDSKTGSATSVGTTSKDASVKGGMTINTTLPGSKKNATTNSNNSNSNNSNNTNSIANGSSHSNSTPSKNKKPTRKQKA